MPVLEIKRSEGQNRSGIKRWIVLLPIARITGFDQENPAFVDFSDFELLEDFDPSLVIIESTHLTGDLNGKQAYTNAGPVIDLDLVFSFPGDETETVENFMKLVDLKYFICFISDLNATPTNSKWKVLGNWQEPMTFSFSNTTTPRKNNIKLDGRVTDRPQWYNPAGDPRIDLV